MEAMSDGFALYEALLWEPPTGYFLLEYHLQRLERSASHFHFVLDITAVRRRLADYSRQLPQQPRKVRLELAASGAIALTDENVKPSMPVAVALAAEPIDSRDEFLRHKTTRRAVFDRALAARPEARDVLLWNERRELTETCHGNVVFTVGDRRLTPPISSGLQPGVFRAHLLDCGEIREHAVPVDAIKEASAIFLINSVRRWCPVHLLGQAAAQPLSGPRSSSEDTSVVRPRRRALTRS
jgi:para-aminobenzoate synthetase/4-amino-4-deoxychorismate lyase